MRAGCLVNLEGVDTSATRSASWDADRVRAGPLASWYTDSMRAGCLAS